MFDLSQQYGDYVVITADGPDDVMSPAVKEQAEKELLLAAHSFIQDESLHHLIKIIHHGPSWVENPDYGIDGDDFEGGWIFTVAWKYTPPKEAAVG